MSVYLKQFSTHQEYEQYINGSGTILPNVSICTTEGDVHYNPWVAPETRVVAKFNVTDTSNPTKIVSQTTGFSSVEIDGVTQPSVTTGYTFSTTGEHTVKYTLRMSAYIDGNAFAYCSGMTSVVIPDSVTRIETMAFVNCSGLTSCTIGSGVTSIGNGAFQGCSALTSIAIPDSVTNIENGAFSDCRSLTSIISNAMTAPTINSWTFYYVGASGTLYVPIGSTGYDVWMGTGSYYLGSYNWTKVEQ